MFGALINGEAICFCKAITAQSRVVVVCAGGGGFRTPLWELELYLMKLMFLAWAAGIDDILGQWLRLLNLVVEVEGKMLQIIWLSLR